MNEYNTAIREMVGMMDSDIPPYVACDRVIEMHGHNLTEGQKGALESIAKEWIEPTAEDLREKARLDHASIYST